MIFRLVQIPQLYESAVIFSKEGPLSIFELKTKNENFCTRLSQWSKRHAIGIQNDVAWELIQTLLESKPFLSIFCLLTP